MSRTTGLPFFDPMRAGFCRVLLGLCLTLLLAGIGWAQPREVRVGAFVTSISGIAPSDASFRTTFYLWFTDPTGQFDPERELEIFARSETVTLITRQVNADGSTYTAVRVDAVVDQAFDLSSYPFDAQSLQISFETVEDSDALSFVPDTKDSALSDSIRLAGWQISGISISVEPHVFATGFGHRDHPATFSRGTVTVDITRDRSIFALEKFTGLLVAFAIAAMVLAVPPQELGVRVGMLTSSVFAAVFNRYRLEDAVGFATSFGLVDQVTFIVFGGVVGVLATSIWRNHLLKTASPPDTLLLARRVEWGLMGVLGSLLVLAFLIALI